jgi:hypothetical protein
VEGRLPQIDDPRVSFQKGLFSDTLPGLKLPKHDLLVLNMDADLYSSTAYVLNTLRDRIAVGTYIYFDEFSDSKHELRAFDEFWRPRGGRSSFWGDGGAAPTPSSAAPPDDPLGRSKRRQVDAAEAAGPQPGPVALGNDRQRRVRAGLEAGPDAPQAFRPVRRLFGDQPWAGRGEGDGGEVGVQTLAQRLGQLPCGSTDAGSSRPAPDRPAP